MYWTKIAHILDNVCDIYGEWELQSKHQVDISLEQLLNTIW